MKTKVIGALVALAVLALPAVATAGSKRAAHTGYVTCDETGVVFHYNANFERDTLVLESVTQDDVTKTKVVGVKRRTASTDTWTGPVGKVVASARWKKGGIKPTWLDCPKPETPPTGPPPPPTNPPPPPPVTPPAPPTAPPAPPAPPVAPPVTPPVTPVTPPATPVCPPGTTKDEASSTATVAVCIKIKLVPKRQATCVKGDRDITSAHCRKKNLAACKAATGFPADIKAFCLREAAKRQKAEGARKGVKDRIATHTGAGVTG